MIYRDKFAELDTEQLPAERLGDDACINCGKNYMNHSGWSCIGGRLKFSATLPQNRYLTQSMALSINNLYMCPVCKKDRCSSPECG